MVSEGQEGAVAATPQVGDNVNDCVDVRYAWPDRSWQAQLVCSGPLSIAEVLVRTGFHRDHPGWDAAAAGVGIDGRLAALDTLVSAGDRLEIYRPLTFDPMVSRRRRAQHKAKQNKGRDGHD